MTPKQKFDANQRREELVFRRDKWTCRVCGKTRADNIVLEAAHLISKARNNRKVLGDEIIFHPLNMVTTCNNRRCNDKVSVGRESVIGLLISQFISEAIHEILDYDEAEERIRKLAQVIIES